MQASHLHYDPTVLTVGQEMAGNAFDQEALIAESQQLADEEQHTVWGAADNKLNPVVRRFRWKRCLCLLAAAAGVALAVASAATGTNVITGAPLPRLSWSAAPETGDLVIPEPHYSPPEQAPQTWSFRSSVAQYQHNASVGAAQYQHDAAVAAAQYQHDAGVAVAEYQHNLQEQDPKTVAGTCCCFSSLLGAYFTCAALHAARWSCWFSTATYSCCGEQTQHSCMENAGCCDYVNLYSHSLSCNLNPWYWFQGPWGCCFNMGNNCECGNISHFDFCNCRL